VSQATSSSASSSSVSLLGIAGLRVLTVFEFVDERHVFVESVRDFDACRVCGQRAVSGGRHVTHIRDLPVGPKATRLVWHKREWRCRDCGRSWREQHPDIAARAVLTERARAEAARQVGELGRPVAAVAREFGVGWETVMRAVTDAAARLFDEQHIYTRQTRLCRAIGVDEKVMNRASRGRRRRYVTVIVDLARGRPLDIIEGRSKRVLRAWLAAQSPTWRAGVMIAALDPAAPYRAALSDLEVGLPNAQLVVDHFHVTKLANAAIDDVRRRVQQATLGHRGRKHDPLYAVRKLLVMAHERLDEPGAARLEAALAAGDPYEEVGCAHVAKELLRAVYAAPDRFAARAALGRFFDWAAEVDIPEVTRLATTIDRWSDEVLAAPAGPHPAPSKPSTARSKPSTEPPAASVTTTTTGSGCCSRPPSPGTLQPPQDVGAAADNQPLPPPRSSRRAPCPG
jgi:transposase